MHPPRWCSIRDSRNSYAKPSRENVLDSFNDYVTKDYLNEETLYAKVTITGGETVRISAWELGGSTGTPTENPPSLQEPKIF